jgi:uncharacterized membrane protein YccC
MKTLNITLLSLTLSAGAAFADTNLATLKSHAEMVRAESLAIRDMLKSKSFDSQAIRQKVESTRDGVSQLQQLMAELEANRPAWADRDPARWNEIVTRVKILGAIQMNKDEVANQTLSKRNLGILRAHAMGVAERAEKLEAAFRDIESKLSVTP